jgi:hypothetical protein
MTDTLPPLPLSDEQIIAVRKQQSGRYGSGGLEPYADSIAFARAILRAALPAAQPTVNPPEFQEVSWGVNSVMRPCLGMAVSEYAFRQWAKDVGVVLAAPVAAQPDTSGVTPCARISEDDLTELERMVSQPSRPACFFPVDADQLANAVLLMIREVRAARGVKGPEHG